MKKITLTLSIIVFLGLISGCEKQNEQITENTPPEPELSPEDLNNLTVDDMPGLEVVNGLLKFDNAIDYEKTLSITSKMTEEELDKWESSLGFTSTRSMVNKAYNELDLCETEGQMNSILDKYNKYIRLTGSGEELSIEPVIFDEAYASISNADGIYLTGHKINKITQSYNIIADTDKYDILKEISNNNIENYLQDNDLKIHEYIYSLQVESDPGLKSTAANYSSLQSTATKNKSGCSNDRRVSIKLYITRSYSIFTNKYTLKAKMKVWGQRKRLCAWIAYTTYLEYYNVFMEIHYKWSSYHSIEKFRGISGGSISGYGEAKNYTGSWIIDKKSTKQTDYYFTKASGSASSRGVGDRWAVISYVR